MTRGVGGEGGARGGRDPNAGGRGDVDRGRRGDGGFSGGMLGATARRTAVQSPSYDATLGNLARMSASLAPGSGLIMGGKAIFDGDFSGGYTGYKGQVGTPGSNDGPNRAMAAQGPGSAMARAGLYQGAGAIPQPMAPNVAKAQALAPAPAPVGPKQWWRTPFTAGPAAGAPILRDPFKAA